MNGICKGLIVTALSAMVSFSALADTVPMTKEQAIEKALIAHPGEIIKAYQETKRGNETWEVQIQGEDGKKWEMLYKIADGSLFMEEEGEGDD